jgi:uncharacterized protein (TIGR02145 family)
MKPKIIRPVAILILFTWAFCNTKAQVTAQDGRTYKTIKIGNQEWMAENLNVSTYRNGDSIPHMQEKGKKMTFKMNVGWLTANKGAWCYYETENGIDTTYGKLYNWFVVNDSRELAPKGWHVPTSEDWKQLGEALGGKDSAGSKMKSTYGWEENGNGTNESGFEGFPGGLRGGEEGGKFFGKGLVSYWWTSTRVVGAFAYYCWLSYSSNTFNYKHNMSNNNAKGFIGLSVRCVKD